MWSKTRSASTALRRFQNSLPSSSPSPAAAALVRREQQEHGAISPAYYSSEAAAATAAEEPGRSSPEVERVHRELHDSILQKRMPQASLLPSLLQNCGTPADVKLAFDALERVRELKAVQGRQFSNYSNQISTLTVEACIRSGFPAAALPILKKRNVYGFTPSLDQAHQLLKHALGQKDTKLMLKVLQTMVASEVFPSPVSAELMLRTCKEAGNTELLFQVAKEMRVNGVAIKKPLFDMLIATAANVGDVKQVHEVQEWREQEGMEHTTASAFALAKSSILEGKTDDAAKMILENCKDSEKRDQYLQIMVKVWPLQVGAKVGEDEKESFLEELKTKVISMCESLTQSGCNVPVDVSEDFAKGAAQGVKSKAGDEVWTPTSATS